jgi:hypothetical protein
MTPPQDRRFEPRRAESGRGVVVAPGLELACLIVDGSTSGLRIRMDRKLSLPPSVQLVDLGRGQCIEAEVAWSKGHEAGLKRKGETSLRGLVPSRLAAARAAFLRFGGR